MPLIVTTGAAACDRNDLETVPRDSVPRLAVLDAGVFIFDVAPVAVIGGGREQSAGHALHLVQGAVLLEGGGVAVGTEGSQSVFVYDSTGGFVREIGRSGEGPGEFRRLRSLHRINADTLAVWDAALRRLTLITTGGVIVGTTTLDGPGRPMTSAAVPQAIHAINPDLFAVVSRFPRRGRPRGLYRDSVHIALRSRTGSRVATIGTIPGDEWFSGRESLLAPLSYRFRAAATAGSLLVGNARGTELVQYSDGGHAVRILDLPIQRRPMGSRDWDRWRAEFVAGSFAPQDRDAVRATLDEALSVDSFPAFTRLAGTADGVWVQLHGSSSEGRPWLLIDPRAARAKRVVLPPDVNVLDSLYGLLVILATDDSGRQEVRVHRIR